MPETKTTEAKLCYGQFPILYEDLNLLVFTNGSGEVFVKNKRGLSAEIRISSERDGLCITSGELITPWLKNGGSAIFVGCRRK